MANFSAADVKQLRELTGAGMMDCKKALEESDGDLDKAIEILRVKGAAKAAKRGAEREAYWSSSTARPTSSPRARSSSRRPRRSPTPPPRPRSTTSRH
jgi:hypothetical protein